MFPSYTAHNPGVFGVRFLISSACPIPTDSTTSWLCRRSDSGVVSVTFPCSFYIVSHRLTLWHRPVADVGHGYTRPLFAIPLFCFAHVRYFVCVAWVRIILDISYGFAHHHSYGPLIYTFHGEQRHGTER